MILNPNLYRDSLDKSKGLLIRGVTEGYPYDTLTLFSQGSHIPFVAVLAYVLRPDMSPPPPKEDLITLYKTSIAFYNYESITPWEDLSLDS